jgi:hypothetical protein
MITPDEILHRPECLDELDPRAAFALATKFQSAASICFQRAFLGLSSSAASATTERAPVPNRLISIKDAAVRINKHRSWLDRHGRRLGIVICDPATGRALGASEHAIARFLGVDPKHPPDKVSSPIDTFVPPKPAAIALAERRA